MLFLRVLLFFTLCTFTAAAPVFSAPVSLQPRVCNLLSCAKKIWLSFTSSGENDVLKQRVAGYWYAEPWPGGSRRDVIYLSSNGEVELLTKAFDMSVVFARSRVWKRLTNKELDESLRLQHPISTENLDDELITEYLPANLLREAAMLQATFRMMVEVHATTYNFRQITT